MPLYLKLALRELRHGARHFAVFLACLILGVCVMTGVGMLSTAIDDALEREAQSLLGGDVEISIGNAAMTPEQLNAIEPIGKISHVATLRSMVQYGDVPTLVEIKAVDDAYPLMGKLILNEAIDPKEALSGNGILVDQSLLSQLDITVGTEIEIGAAKYIIRGTIRKEPDRAVQLFNFGPRVLVRHAALEPSGLLSPLSLIKHRYRVLMHKPQYRDIYVTEFRAQHVDDGWTITTGTDGNQTLKRFIDQLTAFLTLSGLATFLIAGIGIGSSVQAYLQKKSHSIAVMKIMGAERRTIFLTYSITLGLLAMAGALVGIGLAAIAVALLLPVVGAWLPVSSDPELFIPSAVLAGWYGLLITYLFSMPALVGSPNVRPSLLFRSRTAIMRYGYSNRLAFVMMLIIVAMFWTMLFTIPDTNLVLGAGAVILVAFLFFGAAAKLVQRVARGIHPKAAWLKLALGNLHRPGNSMTTVMYAIGISLTVLIALTLTEANFQARITSVAQEKAPSLFMMDIQPAQKDALQTMLTEAAGPENVMLQPMLRTRITELNGKPVNENDVAEDVRWAIRSDRGLSYSPTPPKNATLSQGEWWPADYKGEPLISVDDRFLRGMGLKLGDTVTLDVLGEKITAKIANARQIDYTTFQINFSLMLSPGVVDDYPQTWLATIHQHGTAEEEKQLLRTIARNFPGITIIRTAEAVALVQEVMGYISLALRATVLVSLIAGLIVLASALRAAMEQRLYDTAVLKVLGARRRDLLKTYSAEWMLLAVITSLIACVVGTFGAWLIINRFPGEGFSIMPLVTLTTIALCTIIIWLTGYASNHQLFRIRPARLLRNE